MEKNRIRPIKSGKSSRMSYARQKEVVQMPNLIEVQTDSYKWFLEEGLNEVFDDISPITDYSGKLSLDFVDFTLCEDEVKYTIDECKERDATYAAPLKVKVRLHNKETDEINEHEIFMGDLPLMTRTGTFVINGAERVIVSQLVRSPGIYYAIAHDKLGKKLYSATVIPNRGAWLEYETDSNDVFYVRVDRTRKVPITVLIRALGIGTNPEIIELFGEEPKILASFEKDAATNYQEGLLELYKKIRPGEPLAVDSAESLITSMFFDPRRYDLAKVGRYKFNKKLALKNRISGQVLAEDVASPMTGEVLAEAGTKITRELASAIQNNAVPYVWISVEETERPIKVLSNMMVDLDAVVDVDPEEVGVTEQVYYPVLAGILEETAGDIDELKDAIKRDIHDLIPKHITKEDILASINYNMHLDYGIGTRMFREKGYSAMAFHGYVKTFWNRSEAYKNQGFQHYYSEEELEQTQISGFGITDKEMFRQAVDILKTKQQPFFSFMITLTNHIPYELDQSLASLKLKDSDVGSTFGNYLQTVRYTDEAFGKLIEYLKKNDMYDNTVIAIYGDHQGMNKETPSVQWKMTDFLGKEYDYDEMLNVPFIIHIPGLNESKVADTVGGEVDIMPTIANLMDLDTKQPYVFGHDLLNADEGFVAQISYVGEGSFITSDDNMLFTIGKDGTVASGRLMSLLDGSRKNINEKLCQKYSDRAQSLIDTCKEVLDNNLIANYITH